MPAYFLSFSSSAQSKPSPTYFPFPIVRILVTPRSTSWWWRPGDSGEISCFTFSQGIEEPGFETGIPRLLILSAVHWRIPRKVVDSTCRGGTTLLSVSAGTGAIRFIDTPDAILAEDFEQRTNKLGPNPSVRE